MQKKVLITSVLSEIGVALSQAFRKEGYYVYGLDLEEDYHNYCNRFFRFDLNRFVKDAGYRIKFTAIFEEVIPKLNVLINISTPPPFAKLENIKLEDWQQALNVNLTGPMLLIKLFLDRLEDCTGAIINIPSPYEGVSKAGRTTRNCTNNALIGLTEAISVDTKEFVRVNTISILETNNKEEPENISSIDDYEEIQEDTYPSSPEASQFEGLSKMALFLASKNAEFLTGRNLRMEKPFNSPVKKR